MKPTKGSNPKECSANTSVDPYQVQVREDILCLLPTETQSVLDVGCGDGYVINSFPDHLKREGVDICLDVLQQVQCPHRQASITDLPYPDHSWDMVMANDVLEHLDNEQFAQALTELRRVSARYVLLTVPFMENIQSGMTLCGSCGKQYHVNHHHRSFGSRDMLEMYSDCPPETIVFTGIQMDWGEFAARRFRNAMGILNRWDKAICPYCGAGSSTRNVPEEWAQKIEGVAASLPPPNRGKHPDRTECIAFFDFRREQHPSMDTDISLRYLMDRKLVMGSAQRQSRTDTPVLIPDSPPDSGKVQRCWLQRIHHGTTYLYSNPAFHSTGEIYPPEWFLRDPRDEIDIDSLASNDTLLFGCFRKIMEDQQVQAQRINQLEVDKQNLQAERDALLERVKWIGRTKVAFQNIEAKDKALCEAATRINQLEVDKQNLQAEKESLLKEAERMNYLEATLKNADSELKNLYRASKWLDQLKTDKQNLQTERDALQTQLIKMKFLEEEVEKATLRLKTMDDRLEEQNTTILSLQERLNIAQEMILLRAGRRGIFRRLADHCRPSR